MKAILSGYRPLFPKMRTFRLLMILATVLTLPSHGLAGAFHRSCQEQMTSPGYAADAGDCCPGKADPSTNCKPDGTGKGNPCSACKAGYNCKSPQSYEPASGIVLWTIPTPLTRSTHPPSLISSPSPDGLWRPPQRT